MTGLRFRPIEVAGARGLYAAAGDPGAEPIVLFASPLARGKSYRATAEALAPHFRVYVVEMPGSGRAARLRKPWSLADYAGWMAGLLDSLGLRGATVIGHSHTGGVVLLLPTLFPGRAGRLVVSGGIGVGGPFAFWRVFLGRMADTLLLELGLALRAWHHLASDILLHPRNFTHQTRLCLDSDLSGLATRVNVPVLVAWGERDHTIPPRCGEQLASLLPDATLYRSPTGSHAWPITHAAEFARVAASWVRDTPPAAVPSPEFAAVLA